MRWWRTLRHGLRGLRVWTRYAWGWRPWDFSEAYDAYFLSLRGIRDHVAEHQHHTTWADDVAEMDEALRLWKAHNDAESWEDEDAAWNALHDHMKAHARGWWC